MKRCECGNIIGETQAKVDSRTALAVNLLNVAADAPDDADVRDLRAIIRQVIYMLAGVTKP